MIVVVVREKGGQPSRFEFELPEVQLGRVPGNEIVLKRGNISKRQCKLVERDGRLILIDTKSTSGTYLNGRKITGPMTVQPTDKIYAGDFIVIAGLATAWPDDLDTTPIVEATEIRLLAEIAAGDDHARSVYADWLDEHGRPDRAELLRLQSAYPDVPRQDRQAIYLRMHELAATIEPRWRLRVAHPAIASCRAEACPRAWSELAATERTHVRTCGTCSATVVYCARLLDVATEKGLGNQVAVDLPIVHPNLASAP